MIDSYKPKMPKDHCIYDPENRGLSCFRKDCGGCGWNPVIAEKRKQENKEKGKQSERKNFREN